MPVASAVLPYTPEVNVYPWPVPLHLTATATLQAETAAGVNAIALKNPTGRPMEILEIKFGVRDTGDQQTSISTSTTSILGGLIACRLDMGSLSLTNGYIPIWSFGKATNLKEEAQLDTVVSASPITEAYAEYTWKLAHPIYVPPGAAVVPSFFHRGLLKDTMVARISYSARSLPPGPAPKKLWLPYVSCYTTKAFTVGAAIDSDTSQETDLVNPHPQPLYLQRFTGRCMIIQQSGGYLAGETGVFDTIANQSLLLKMIDSAGRPVIKDYVVFRQAFSGVTRSWEMDLGHIMDPTSHYNVQVQSNIPTGAGGAFAGLLAQGFVGCVGFRQIVGA
jgi:hypothetical protein